MQLKQVSDNCFAVLNEKNRVCDANSGLINRAGGVVIDTQSDLPHARQMIEMFSKVWPAMPQARHQHARRRGPRLGQSTLRRRRDHRPPVGARADEARRRSGGNPETAARCRPSALTRWHSRRSTPASWPRGSNWLEDYNLDGIELVLPTTLFDTRYELDLDGTEVHLIYVGPCHQVGDTIIHVPKERVVFAGDVLFRQCTPMGWTGSYEKWFQCLDLIIQLNPEVIVPGHGPLCGIEGVTETESVPPVRP